MNFGFYKVDPAWRRLPAEDRKRGKCQFIDVVKSYDQDVMTIAYSMIGVRGDCDFMLWRIGFDLLKFQEMMAKLLETGSGQIPHHALFVLVHDQALRLRGQAHPRRDRKARG